MRILSCSRALFSFLIALALIAGCGAESVPSCADVSWLGNLNHAQLTGSPSFSAAQIAPGDALTIAVPVDVNTRVARVLIRSFDETPLAFAYRAETDGGEIVEISIEDTDLPPRVYLAYQISLEGEIAPQFAQYIAADFDTPYVLSVFPAAESQLSCVTDIFAPTFTVVSDSANAALAALGTRH